MITKSYIEELVSGFLSDSDIYIVDIDMEEAESVSIYIDKMSGLTVKDCMSLNRKIDDALTEAKLNVGITVSSAGIDNPFKVLNQYLKNIGRTIEVKLVDGAEFEALMVDADDNGAHFEWEERVKINGKNKKVQRKEFYEYKQIKTAKVVIAFK